jgi:hypothetical protein
VACASLMLSPETQIVVDKCNRHVFIFVDRFKNNATVKIKNNASFKLCMNIAC